MAKFIITKDEKGKEIILNLEAIAHAEAIHNQQVRGTSILFIGTESSVVFEELSFDTLKVALGIQG